MPPSSADTYKLLKDKMKKVDSFLGALRVNQDIRFADRATQKKYRDYQKKKKEYHKRLEKTREYKENKLKTAVDELRTSLHSASLHSVDLSVFADDDDPDSSSYNSDIEDSIEEAILDAEQDRLEAAEHAKLVQEARKNHQAELAIAKEQVLLKLRKKAAKHDEHTKAQKAEAAYALAERVANDEFRQGANVFELEAQKRVKEGLVKISHK